MPFSGGQLMINLNIHKAQLSVQFCTIFFPAFILLDNPTGFTQLQGKIIQQLYSLTMNGSFKRRPALLRRHQV